MSFTKFLFDPHSYLAACAQAGGGVLLLCFCCCFLLACFSERLVMYEDADFPEFGILTTIFDEEENKVSEFPRPLLVTFQGWRCITACMQFY